MNKKIVPYLCIIITTFFLGFVFYKDYLVFSFSLNSLYRKYYYLSIILYFFSFLTFYIKPNIVNSIFLLLVSLTFSLQLINIYFYFQGEGRLVDKRKYFEVYFDLKKKYPNENVAVRYGPGNVLIEQQNNKENYLLPFSGISNSITPICNESGEWSIIKSDRYGFNNPDTEWNKLFVDSIFLGDSFTYGACVSQENNIVSQYRKLLNNNKSSSLNLGYLSNGPLLYYTTFKEYAKTLNPKHVFFMYWEGNDLSNLYKELKSQLLNRYINNSKFSQNLKNRQKEIDEFWKNKYDISDKKFDKRTRNIFIKFVTFHYIREYLRYNKLAQYNLDNRNNILKSQEETYLPNLEIILKKLNTKITTNGGNFYFVYLPNFQRFKQNIKEKNKYQKKNKILEILNRNKIQLIDISVEFEKYQNPIELFPLSRDAHYNEKGYKLVAEKIFKEIN